MLRKNLFSAEQIIAIVKDYRQAGLDPAEVAMMNFVQKIIRHAHTIKSEDVDDLRVFGLSDAEILDIVLATTLRAFWSKTLDAIGAEPDDAYLALEPELREALSLGRPFMHQTTRKNLHQASE